MSISVYGIIVLPTSNEMYCQLGTQSQLLQAAWHAFPLDVLFGTSLFAGVYSTLITPSLMNNDGSYRGREDDDPLDFCCMLGCNRFHEGYVPAAFEASAFVWFLLFNKYAWATSCKSLPCETGCQWNDWMVFVADTAKAIFCEVAAFQCVISGLMSRTIWPLIHFFMSSNFSYGCLALMPLFLCCWAAYLLNPGSFETQPNELRRCGNGTITFHL